MKIKIILLIITVISLTTISPAQSGNLPEEYNFYNSQTLSYYSASVGDSLKIFVSLPENYSESGLNYPVLYVLDGDISFGMVTSIARYLEVGNNIPAFIIVGIGYGSDIEDAKNKRQRDYSPTVIGNNPNTGGANNFLKFLGSELIPLIDSRYNTDDRDRTIYGYSLAGLFCFHTLFTQTDLFDNYIIGSAYLNWDNKAIFEIEKLTAEKRTDIDANVFVSVGDQEDEDTYFKPIDQMVTTLQERNYTSLNLITMVIDSSSHLSSPPTAITQGLLSIFNK